MQGYERCILSGQATGQHNRARPASQGSQTVQGSNPSPGQIGPPSIRSFGNDRGGVLSLPFGDSQETSTSRSSEVHDFGERFPNVSPEQECHSRNLEMNAGSTYNRPFQYAQSPEQCPGVFAAQDHVHVPGMVTCETYPCRCSEYPTSNDPHLLPRGHTRTGNSESIVSLSRTFKELHGPVPITASPGEFPASRYMNPQSGGGQSVINACAVSDQDPNAAGLESDFGDQSSNSVLLEGWRPVQQNDGLLSSQPTERCSENLKSDGDLMSSFNQRAQAPDRELAYDQQSFYAGDTSFRGLDHERNIRKTHNSQARPTRRGLKQIEKEEVAIKKRFKVVCERHRRSKTKVRLHGGFSFARANVLLNSVTVYRPRS